MWNDTDSFLNDRQLKLIITIWIFEITKLFVKNKKLTVTNVFKCGHYIFFAGIICCLILLIIFIIKFIVQYNSDDIKPIEWGYDYGWYYKKTFYTFKSNSCIF